MSDASGPRASTSTTTVIAVDPKILAAVAAVKADTQAILEKIQSSESQEVSKPQYFPRGYFP